MNSLLVCIALLATPSAREVGLDRIPIVVDTKRVVPVDDFLTYRDLQNIHMGIALGRLENLRRSN